MNPSLIVDNISCFIDVRNGGNSFDILLLLSSLLVTDGESFFAFADMPLESHPPATGFMFIEVACMCEKAGVYTQSGCTEDGRYVETFIEFLYNTGNLVGTSSWPIPYLRVKFHPE